GSCARPTGLFDAERVRLRIAHDRPRALVVGFRLLERRAELLEAFELGFAVVGAEIEVDRVGRGPRPLAALEEQAQPGRRRLARHVEGLCLALVHAGVEQLLDEALVDRLLGPAKCMRPEGAETLRLRARRGDGADAARVGARRRLDAEAVALEVAHHGPRLR